MASPLLDKSKAFALEIIRVCNIIKSTRRKSVLTNQLPHTTPPSRGSRDTSPYTSGGFGAVQAVSFCV